MPSKKMDPAGKEQRYSRAEDKRTVDELRESEERSRLLVDALPDGVVVHSEGRVVFANPASAKIIGAAGPADLIGKPVMEFVHPDYRELALTRIQQSIREGRPAALAEEKFIRLDGTSVDVEVSAIPFHYAGKPAMLTVFNDITERKRAAEALSKSEDKFNKIFDAASEGILLADPITKKFIQGNTAICTMLGYTKEEIKNLSLYDIHPPEDIPHILDEFEKRLKGDQVLGEDVPVLRKDGSIFYADIGSARTTIGGINFFLGTFRDSTERKRAKEALLESEKSLREAQHLVHLGSWQWTIATDTVTWSEELFHINGRDPNLRPLSFAEMSSCYTPESWQRLGAAVAKARQSGESYELDLEMVRPDGATRLTSARGQAVYDAGGKIVGLHGTVQDITERRREQEAFLKLAKAVNTSSEAIFMTDLEGLMIFVNPAFANLYGYSAAEVVNKTTPRILKSGLMKEEDYESFWRALMEKQTVKGEHINKTKDGRLLNIEGSASPILDEGRNIIGFLAIQRDITERKRAEEALRASLREKEVLLQEVHHRVKNNMQVISSLFNLQSGHTTNEECRAILKEGQTRIRSMSLVHEKLYQSHDLSKIDFAAYIQSLADHLFHVYLVDPAQVRLDTELEAVALDVFSAIPCGLILNELISNALKYAFPEGRTGAIKIGLRRRGDDAIEIRVADDGIGLPEGANFRNAESFGLQIVNLLVGQLEAAIDLDQTKGTAFTITFHELKYSLRI